MSYLRKPPQELDQKQNFEGHGKMNPKIALPILVNVGTPGVAKKTLVFGGEILRSKINFRIYLISVVLRPKQSLFSEIFSKIYKGDLKL